MHGCLQNVNYWLEPVSEHAFEENMLWKLQWHSERRTIFVHLKNSRSTTRVVPTSNIFVRAA